MTMIRKPMTGTVRDGGAKLDGVTDDAAAFARAAVKGANFVPAGTTFLSIDVGGVFFSNGPVLIKGDGYANIVNVAAAPRPTRRSELIAHRGFANASPQNTVMAFSRAIELGADCLELDVQMSADGVPYVFHDTTVDALTNGAGNFTALTAAQVDALTFDALVGTTYAAEGIPRLAEVLDLARAAGVRVMPEVKGVWTDQQLAVLVQVLTDYGFNNDRCTIQSGYIVYVETLRGLSPAVELAYVGVGNWVAAEPFVIRLKRLGNAALMWIHDDLLSDPQIVTKARAKGVDVIAWTVTTGDLVRRLQAVGVSRLCCESALQGVKK